MGFPVLFHADNNWILISEAGLVAGYWATHLKQEYSEGLYSITFPEPDERLGGGEPHPSAKFPWGMTWRFIVIGDSLNRIVEFSMVYHLAESSKLKIHPGLSRGGHPGAGGRRRGRSGAILLSDTSDSAELKITEIADTSKSISVKLMPNGGIVMFHSTR